MNSRYDSWSTDDLLVEIIRLKQRIKESLTVYGSTLDKDKLLAITKVLEKRRNN